MPKNDAEMRRRFQMYRGVDYDEMEILDLYERYESAKPVAATVGVSDQTVYRVLIKHGVKRTHRHERTNQKKYRPNGCNTKYCPALVVMLRTILDMRCSEIISATGYTQSAVGNIITRHGLTDKRRRRDIDEQTLDAIEAEYLAGATTYELGDKYGVHHGTITKWMAKRGHVRGKGYVSKERLDKNAEAREASAAIRKEQMLERKRERDAILQQQRAEREAEKEKRRLEREAEYAKEKHCASCGAVFHSEYKTKIYCSDTCARREKRHRNVALGKTKLHDYSNHRKRARLHGVPYEPGITIEKLMVRDNGICQICGQPCDVDDLRWGYSGPMYPSIDHIIAMANGGPHTWGNVQLAHVICNSFKRDLTPEEMAEEVRQNAEKQTA